MGHKGGARQGAGEKMVADNLAGDKVMGNKKLGDKLVGDKMMGDKEVKLVGEGDERHPGGRQDAGRQGDERQDGWRQGDGRQAGGRQEGRQSKGSQNLVHTRSSGSKSGTSPRLPEIETQQHICCWEYKCNYVCIYIYEYLCMQMYTHRSWREEEMDRGSYLGVCI
jgi:hypothetical protein